jgi:hypothetical protein
MTAPGWAPSAIAAVIPTASAAPPPIAAAMRDVCGTDVSMLMGESPPAGGAATVHSLTLSSSRSA